jgi:predicted dehydrogenase
MADSVRWGFLGAGFIATTALAPAVHRADGAELQAVAARQRTRAESLEPSTSYDSYQDLLDDPSVEAIYISLPNDAPLPWALASLRAGTPVLCEKPLTLNSSECRDAQSAARESGLLLVEATWMRWHPRYRRADALLGGGASGRVRDIRGTFTFDGVPENNYRLDPARGGGALLDLGPYLLAPATDWCSDEWTSIAAECSLNERGADLTTDATLSSRDTSVALRASIAHPEHQALTVKADGLTVEWEDEPFTSWQAPAALTLTGEARQWRETFEPCDAYQLMVEQVSLAVRGDASAFIPDPSLSQQTARLIDRIRASSDPTADLEPAEGQRL